MRSKMGQKSRVRDLRQAVADVQDESTIEIGYSDSDIMLIDNIRALSEPDPIRVDMNAIAFCKQGRMQGLLDGVPVTIGRGEAIICAPNAMIDNVMVSPDFECAALCITTNGLRNILHSNMNVWTQAVYVNRISKVKLSEQDDMFYQQFYNLLGLCIDAGAQSTAWKPFRGELVQTLIKCALLGLCTLLTSSMDSVPEKHQATDSIFSRFISLLQNSEIKHRPVEEYAQELFISPKYLTVICKKQSGKTANDWIREYTLADINYYLRSTDFSAKEIAHKTGFLNVSFFGKYVKEHCGMPPMKYREMLRKT
uniref:Helix-turn-helix domain-containing protein n=2 Tax=unclassified Prevotella TaxID=2638335 RepID=A0AB33JIZ6_9BACT